MDSVSHNVNAIRIFSFIAGYLAYIHTVTIECCLDTKAIYLWYPHALVFSSCFVDMDNAEGSH